MSDVMVFGFRSVVTRADLVAGGEEFVDFRHHDACSTVAREVARNGRVILYPSLLVRERPSDVMDGLEISIRTLTVPVEFA